MKKKGRSTADITSEIYFKSKDLLQFLATVKARDGRTAGCEISEIVYGQFHQFLNRCNSRALETTLDVIVLTVRVTLCNRFYRRNRTRKTRHTGHTLLFWQQDRFYIPPFPQKKFKVVISKCIFYMLFQRVKCGHHPTLLMKHFAPNDRWCSSFFLSKLRYR